MAKPEWGSKRLCQSCGTKFYDLQKDPILCPSCGTRFDPEALLKSRRARTEAPKSAKPAPAKPKAEEEAVDDELLVEDGDDADVEDDSVLEDADDLGGDDEDLGQVVANDDDKES